MKQFIPYRSKIVRGLMALVFTLGFGAGVASAASPHFLKADFDITSTGQLSCSFKEAGLGNDVVLITCASDLADATYFCINRGGNHPAAQNKETVSAAVSNTQPFSPRNGQITGTLLVSAPGPGSFSCPGGQDLFLVEVTYNNASLTDNTNAITVFAEDNSISSGCLLPAKYQSLCP